MNKIGVWFLKRWPSLVGALLFLLAYAPFNIWPLMFVALAPMLSQLRKADSKEAWRIGYLFGFTLFLGQMFWLYILANHWIHRPFLSLVPWIITAVLEGLFFGWVARLARHCWLRGWPILIPVAWAGMEVARSYFPVVALPWGLVATPLYKAPILIQAAHFGTIYLVSAWVVLLNTVLAMVVDKTQQPKARPLIAVFLLMFAFSIFEARLSPPSRPLDVTVGQPGIDMAFGDRETRSADIATSVNQISDQAVRNHSKLLILPEGIGNDSHNPPRPPFVIDKSLPVLFGGQRDAGKLTYQTAFGYDGEWHSADKTRLVIFGEFVPGRASFPWIAKTFDLPTDDLSASTKGVQSVRVAGSIAGPMLCFEALFPDVSFQQAKNGAQFISVMCIDDWYMGTPAPDQLKAASIFRAVETGLPLVRSASLGSTLALDGHGNTLGELPLRRAAGLNVTLQLPTQPTYFPFLFVFPGAAMLFAIVLPWLPKRAAKKPVEESS
jgi:apolipoprotein N-acyltransferase